MALALMAKKVQPPKAKMGRPPAPQPRNVVTALKSRPEWAAWLAGFAESENVERTKLIERAIAHYAKAKGYETPPER